MARFAVGDHAMIVRGPGGHGYVDLDDTNPDQYHYLIVGSVVEIKTVYEYGNPEWGTQYAVAPLDPNAWATPREREQAYQYVFDIHLTPHVEINTSDITEIEKFLAT